MGELQKYKKLEVTQLGTNVKLTPKVAIDKLVEIYNRGIYESAAECARSYQLPERLLYQWLSASKK